MQAQDTEIANSNTQKNQIVTLSIPENTREDLKRNKIQYIHGLPDDDCESTQSSVLETIRSFDGKKPITSMRPKKVKKMTEGGNSVKFSTFMKNFFCVRIFACFNDDDDDCVESVPLELPVLTIEIPNLRTQPNNKNIPTSRRNTESTVCASNQEPSSKKDSIIADETMRIELDASYQHIREISNMDEIIDKIEAERIEMDQSIAQPAPTKVSSPEALHEYDIIVKAKISNEIEYDHIESEPNECEKKEITASPDIIVPEQEIKDKIAELSFGEDSDSDYSVVSPHAEKDEWELHVSEEKKPQQQDAEHPALD